MNLSSPPRILFLTLFTAVGWLFLSILWSPVANAHASVVTQSPANDSVIDTAPDMVTIDFTEAISVVAGETTVIGPHGEPAVSEPASVSGSTLIYRLDTDLSEGTYLVTYRVISADGHPVAGAYTFSIGQASAVPKTAVIDADPLVKSLVVANRALGYAGLGLTLGAAVTLVALPNTRDRAPARATSIGLSTVAATAMIGLYLQVPYTVGSSLFGFTGGDVGTVLAGPFAAASMIRLLIVLTALPLLRVFVLGNTGRSLRIALTVLGGSLIFTWPFSGHATTSAAPWLAIASDAVHLGAGMLWAGGLLGLVRYLRRDDLASEAEQFLPIWSTLAGWLVVMLSATGIANALMQVNNVSSLFTTAYGRFVLIKSGLLVAVLAVASLSRKAVQQRKSLSTRTRLKRLVSVELLVIAAVVAVTAVLVQTAPPSQTTSARASTPTVFSTELESDLFVLHVELAPASIGTNEVNLTLRTTDGEPIPVLEWAASFTKLDSSISPIKIDMTVVAPDKATASLTVPSAGEWEFEFKIRVSEIDRRIVSTVIFIE